MEEIKALYGLFKLIGQDGWGGSSDYKFICFGTKEELTTHTEKNGLILDSWHYSIEKMKHVSEC